MLSKKLMKQRAHLISLVALALGSLPFAAACDGSTSIAGIHMTNPDTVEVVYGGFVYEDIYVTVDFRNGDHTDIPLTEEMISPVEQMKFFQIGEQSVEVVYRNRYSTTMPINVVFNQFYDSYALVGYTCVYDGQPHAVTLNQELPEGATITYPYGNIFSNAGTYEVVGIISKNGYESRTLQTELTILPAEHDDEAIEFNDTTVIYDGEAHTIEAKNVPEGVEVTYDAFDVATQRPVNNIVNAGKYRVVAHFNDTSPNYVKIEDHEAYLTIEKARYDVSGIRLESVTREYDGEEYDGKSALVGTLPTGLSVEFEYYDENDQKVESNANAGKYTMVGNFVSKDAANYYELEPLKATLTVSKRVIKISDIVSFPGKTVTFDGQAHPLEIVLAAGKSLPENVTVTYENNENIYAGEYEIKAKFASTKENETVDVTELTAYLVINKDRRSVKVYNPDTEEYDAEFTSNNIEIQDGIALVVGLDINVYKVGSIHFYLLSDNTAIDPSKFLNGQTYKYVVTFLYLDDNLNDSVILSEASDNFTYTVG